MAEIINEVEVASIKRKSFHGVMALVSRTFVLQIIAFTATFLLTIFLTPQVFGVFYLVSAFIAFLNYFSDVGLAAALIQKKETLDKEDLITTFTIQQILVIAISVIAFVLSPMIGSFYSLDISGVWLLRALIISFFLSSLKTIPSVLLERGLEFNKLVLPQVAETLGFYIVAVTMAAYGHGVTSFTWAVLVRGIVGLIGIYIVSPWSIRIGISLPVARRLMRFGIPFQINSFLALLKDDLLTIVLGKMLPLSEIGYIGWAKKWAEVPLRLIMDSVIRVTFPVYARLQESKETLGKAIDNTLFALGALLLPISAGLLFFVSPAIALIPKYGKWEPALVSFYFFVVTAAIAAFSTTLTNALNAIGKIRVTLNLMILWTILGWALTLWFVYLFGFVGVALALFVISWTIVIVVMLVKKHVHMHVLASLRGPLIAVLAQCVLYMFALKTISLTALPLVAVAMAGVILYGAILWLMEKNRIMQLMALRKLT
jgi:O-antigen/teichoic acid export membrane protein